MTYDETRARLIPNSAEYQKIHRWVIKQLGKAVKCVNGCKSSKYEWSNISRNYLKDLSDWEQVCSKCHKKRDKITETGRLSISRKNKINSLGNTSHNTPIVSIHRSTGGLTYYPSLTLAASTLGVLRTSISNCLTGRSKSAYNYYWHYAGGRV